MANTYQQEAIDAAADIKEAGWPVTFYTPATSGGGRDPATGDPLPDTPRVEIKGHGLVFGYKANDVDGTTIQRQDAYVLYTGAKPTNGMFFDDANGKKWTVQHSEPLAPTVATILYKVQIR